MCEKLAILQIKQEFRSGWRAACLDHKNPYGSGEHMQKKSAAFVADFLYRGCAGMCSITGQLTGSRKFLLTPLARTPAALVSRVVFFAGLYGAFLSGAAAQVGDQGSRVLALYQEQKHAEQRDSGPWERASSGLELCATARDMSYRETSCIDAGNRVTRCMEASSDW